MHGYKIYTLDRAGHIALAYDFEGADDAAALEEAKKHSGKAAVEVWERSRLVAHIEQDSKAASG
jgi:hypothetical protein